MLKSVVNFRVTFFVFFSRARCALQKRGPVGDVEHEEGEWKEKTREFVNHNGRLFAIAARFILRMGGGGAHPAHRTPRPISHR
jgi:hypothetical protein